MASAAAVASDVSEPPVFDSEPNSELAPDDSFLKDAGIEGDDDEDDDIRPSAGRRKTSPPANLQDSGGEDESIVNGAEDDEGAGLFGSEIDEDDDLGSSDHDTKRLRRLDDEDLDSGDDDDRDDRRLEDEDEMRGEQAQEEEFAFMDVDLVRHPIPDPSDGELYLLKVPPFLSIDPHAFQHQTFQPPVTDHHSKGPPSNTFSAYKTAMTTIRWRRSPRDPSQLQSNARVVRWSDGSLTLQFASNPSNHYSISGNPLAPPQRNPAKPTPVSLGDGKRRGGPGNKSSSYNPELDSFTYLAAGHQRSEVLRITNKFTAGLKVQSATDASAEALERLQNSLAAAGNAMGDSEGSGIGVIKITEDPELAKKKAEIAEKEKLKAQRRREAQEARDRDRQGRVFGRRGAGLGVGLTVGGLEDEDDLGRGSGRLPGASGRKNQAKRSRRGEIYSDDEEDYGRRGRTREDEYDQEDDFLAPSDEEEVVEESDEDEDDGIVEQPRPSSRKLDPSAQRGRDVTPVGEQDAEGDLEDESAMPHTAAGSPQGARKRRRVIEEDEDEEE